MESTNRFEGGKKTQIAEEVKSFKKNCGVVPKPRLWNVVRNHGSLSPGARRVGEKSLQNLAPVLPREGSGKRASKLTYAYKNTSRAQRPPRLVPPGSAGTLVSPQVPRCGTPTAGTSRPGGRGEKTGLHRPKSGTANHLQATPSISPTL